MTASQFVFTNTIRSLSLSFSVVTLTQSVTVTLTHITMSVSMVHFPLKMMMLVDEHKVRDEGTKEVGKGV